MAAVGKLDASFYVERAETSRLAWPFGISLALHLLIFGGYETGRKFGWWQNWQWPAWLQPVKTLAELLKAKQPPTQPQPQDVPLMFVDVSPAQESTEPPKQSPFIPTGIRSRPIRMPSSIQRFLSLPANRLTSSGPKMCPAPKRF